MKTIIFTTAADKQLAELPTAVQTQITEGLITYATKALGDVKRLVGRQGLRLRVGRYRVLFDEDEQTVTIYVGKCETTTYGNR